MHEGKRKYEICEGTSKLSIVCGTLLLNTCMCVCVCVYTRGKLNTQRYFKGTLKISQIPKLATYKYNPNNNL